MSLVSREEPLEDLVMECRLRWFGHPDGMGEETCYCLRAGKEDTMTRTKKRWRDGITSDLRATGWNLESLVLSST